MSTQANSKRLVATNIDVDVDASQHASNSSSQFNGDSFGIFLAPLLRRG